MFYYYYYYDSGAAEDSILHEPALNQNPNKFQNEYAKSEYETRVKITINSDSNECFYLMLYLFKRLASSS